MLSYANIHKYLLDQDILQFSMSALARSTAESQEVAGDMTVIYHQSAPTILKSSYSFINCQNVCFYCLTVILLAFIVHLYDSQGLLSDFKFMS